MKVVISSDARQDLLRIALHIARDNPVRARSFIGELRDKARQIGTMPRAFPLIPLFETRGIRRRSWRGYGMLYSLSAEHVLILRFVGPGQDHDRLLGLGTE